MKFPTIKDPCPLCGDSLFFPVPNDYGIGNLRCNNCIVHFSDRHKSIYIYNTFNEGWIYSIDFYKLAVLNGRDPGTMKDLFPIESDSDLKEIMNKISKIEIFR